MSASRFTFALASAVSLIALTACGGAGTPDGETPEGPVVTQEAATPETMTPVKLETPPAGQLPDGVTPLHYTLDLVTDPSLEGFTGTVTIKAKLDQPHDRIWLHALEQRVTKAQAVLADGTEIAAEFTGKQADGGVSRLDFAETVPAGEATLVIDYEAPYNFGLAGLYKASQAGKPYLATQMEPIDARRMFPGFDEPRFKTPFKTFITAPSDLQVITNGPNVSSEELSEGLTRHEFAETRTIQTYLIALAVGPYDERVGEALPPTDVRDRAVEFRAFAPAGKGDRLKEAMDATQPMLEWQEAYFDYPYPYAKLDLIAVPEFAYGAMENAGAIIYREGALLIDDKTSLGRKRGILTTHAHELGHQWFGNLVTPKWWDDIWLNEAFATWISYKTMHAYDPDGGFDRSATRAGLGAMSSDGLANARQIRNPIDRNADIMDAFDGITYRKGGHVLSMFENYLGEDQFREGMRLHMKRYEDGVADVNDFMQSLADGSGNPEVVESFKSFIFQPGIPMLDVQVSCERGAGKVTVTQSRYAQLGSNIDTEASTWRVPFAATVNGSAGERTVREMLTGKITEIALDTCPDYVMPNADGAGYWRFTTNEDNWTALADNFASLSPGEQLVFSDSLTAGFAAGSVSADALLTGLEATTDGEWDGVRQPMGRIASYGDLIPTDARPALNKWVQTTYQNNWDDLGDRPALGLSQGDRLLRESLYSLLVKNGEMIGERSRLAEAAMAYVGVGGAPDASALLPSELSTGLSIAAETGGQAFYDAALAYALATDNQREKRTVLGAIAGSGDARMVADIMKRSMGNGFSGNDIYSVMLSAMSNDNHQDTAWPVFQASFDNAVRQLPEIRKPQMARVAGAFCSTEKAAQAAAFFESKADMIPGYERSLAQGVERAQLCEAMKDAKSEELAAALAARLGE